ncbi:MAG: hypothetical protein ACRD5H_06320, partial [Nitrososphaerales archaeon]
LEAQWCSGLTDEDIQQPDEKGAILAPGGTTSYGDLPVIHVSLFVLVPELVFDSPHKTVQLMIII